MNNFKVNYAITGIFVILLSMVLIASILWLSVGIEYKKYRTYQVYTNESVSGLNYKAQVKYLGVEVGYVQDISLVPKRAHEVQILLQIEEHIPIKQDTFVTLSVQGLTGLAHIELIGGSLNTPVLKTQAGQLFPEIATKPSLLTRLDIAVFEVLKNLNRVSLTTNGFLSQLEPQTINQLFNNISHLSQMAENLFSKKNQLAISHILENFETISYTLASQSDDLTKGISYLVQSANSLNELTIKVASLVAQMEQNLAAIETTSHTFNQTAVSINDVVASIDNTNTIIAKTATEVGIAVKETRKDMDYFTRQALPEVTNALQEMHLLLSHLRNFAQKLKQKPNILLFGKSDVPKGPGE